MYEPPPLRPRQRADFFAVNTTFPACMQLVRSPAASTASTVWRQRAADCLNLGRIAGTRLPKRRRRLTKSSFPPLSYPHPSPQCCPSPSSRGRAALRSAAVHSRRDTVYGRPNGRQNRTGPPLKKEKGNAMTIQAPACWGRTAVQRGARTARCWTSYRHTPVGSAGAACPRPAARPEFVAGQVNQPGRRQRTRGVPDRSGQGPEI